MKLSWPPPKKRGYEAGHEGARERFLAFVVFFLLPCLWLLFVTLDECSKSYEPPIPPVPPGWHRIPKRQPCVEGAGDNEKDEKGTRE